MQSENSIQPVQVVTPQNNLNPQTAADVTPVNTSQATYASFWRRLVAMLTDSFLMFLVGFVIGFIPSFIYSFGGNPEPQMVKSLVSIIAYFVAVTYYVYFIGSNGQTLGKKWFGIKVVKVGTSEAPGYLKAFLREVIGKIISTVVLLLGYIWMLWDPQKQTWHDKIAGTVVVRV